MSIIPFLNDKHIRLHTFDNRNIVTVVGVGSGSGSVAGLGRGWMSSEGWAGTGADTGGLRSFSCEGTQSKFTFTFMHLADAFIQSDLQYIQVIHFFCQYVFPGNRTHNLCAANTMLYQWAAGTLTKQISKYSLNNS